MNRKILVSAVAVCALGTAGIAFAEGTTKKQDRDPTAESGTMQGNAPQGSSDVSGSEQADVGQESEGMQQTETAKRGVERLDSIRISALDEQHATMLQQKLADLGYYKAEVDGKFGPKSKAALSQYFRDQAQLVQQGKVSELALSSLGFGDDEIERVRGVDAEGDEEQRTPTRGFDDVDSDVNQGPQGGSQGSPGSGMEGSDIEP